MLTYLFLQATAPIQTQGFAPALPPQADALLRAKDWAGLADWFDTVPPATRGTFYEQWIQSLNRSQRWDRLLTVCEALQRMAAFWKQLEAAGHAIASIDVGGGLGVRYRDGEQAPAARDYAMAIREALHGFEGRILVEPGRWLVAEAGKVL